MIRFLKKTILFLAAFLLLCIIVNLILREKNRYAVNDIYVQKKKYLIKNKNKYNTIIFGSSRLYRQVNPEIINNQLKEYGISSFNLASPATFNPELYYLYEELIKNNDLSIHYAFLEITDLNVIALKNLFTIRTYYIADWRYLKYTFHYIHDSGRPIPEKIYFYITYGMSYILNHVIPPNINTITNNPEADPIQPYGFYSLNEELKNGDKDEVRYILDRHEKFLNDTTEIQNRIRSAKKAFSMDRKHTNINETHVNKLKHLIKISQEKGIELYFIIPPMHKDYDEIADIPYAFADERIINLADYDKYEDLFTSKNMFDIGHLNLRGSNKLSTYLAEEFKKNLSSDN